MEVRDKVFVVTGAGSGIGSALSLCLLSKGARVAGVDLDPTALSSTAELGGQQFAAFTADVSQRSVVEALPDQILARFGVVDGLINNAGIIQPFLRLNDLEYSTIERVLNVNLFDTLFTIKAFLPHLLQRPEAHIANVSSMGGFVPVPGQTIYCASKAAVKLLSEGLAAELDHTDIRVSVVFPGAVATNIRGNSGAGDHQLNHSKAEAVRVLAPAKAAEIIVQGIERGASRIFVGRDAAFMDKFYRLSPGYATRAIASRMRALLPA